MSTSVAHGGSRAANRVIGVALGGGAARGMVHVGALKAIEAAGASVGAVAGTSYGAVIAALYALSGNALELERIIRSADIGELWSQAFDFGLHEGALIRGKRLADWLDRKFFFGATFDDVRLPLAIACTDLTDGQLTVLRSGLIADAVRASCALPGLFAPVRLDERVLIDGGLVETVPFRALAALPADTHIGVHAGVDVSRSRFIRTVRRFAASRRGRSFYRHAARIDPRGPFGQIIKGMAVSMRSYSRPVRSPRGSFLLSIEPNIAWWDFHRSPQAIASGEKAMSELLAALPRRPAPTAAGGSGPVALRSSA
ncbi:MAG TPA: patatin-like phospholipase family protein [Trueperaceae bacterium]|nr:patatin-like phospholipase family protein [Trueperaceae bacterium]